MRNSNDVKTIIKLVHDYQAKETHIDLVRESKMTEKAVIKNKVTDFKHFWYNDIRSPVDIILEPL